MRKDVAGKVAAVTGAGSGIGRAVALELSRRGVRLALADWDEQGLQETGAMLNQDCLLSQVDVGDRKSVARFADESLHHFGVIHQVYNIAGVGGGAKSIDDEEYSTFERTLRVNLWGVIHGTKEFLPHLIRSGDGHVINVSSLNGIMAQPGNAAYCTSKFAVRGFTESLRAEMIAARIPVAVTVVHPGGVRTAIRDAKPVSLGGEPGALEAEAALTAEERHRNEVYKQRLFKMSAEEAADIILRGVERGNGRVLLGQSYWVDRLVRAVPAHYPRIVAAWSQRMFSGA